MSEEKLVVDVYYEVLCPDSKAFLLYQVLYLSPLVQIKASANLERHFYLLIVIPAQPRLVPAAKHLHRQLHPLWQSSSKWDISCRSYHLISLKTYGEGSSLSFSCQHGPVECEVCKKKGKPHIKDVFFIAPIPLPHTFSSPQVQTVK